MTQLILKKKKKKNSPYDIKWVMLRDSCTKSEAIVTINELKDSTKQTEKNFIKRYGKEIGLVKWEEYKISKNNFSEEIYREKYGDSWEKYYQERINNTVQTLENYIKWYGKEEGEERYKQAGSKRSYSSSTLGLIENHGKEKAELIRQSKEMTPDRLLNQRKTLEKNGSWTPLEQMDDLRLYYLRVSYFTKKQDINKLSFSERRGNTNGRDSNKSFHLDHKISKREGFDQGILPQIIGDITNLQFLSYDENVQKGKKCYSAIRREECE